MRNGNDVDRGRSFAKDDYVRELAKQEPPGTKCECWKMFWLFRNLIDRLFKVPQKPPRGSMTSLRIPVNRRPCLFERRRVDLDGPACHRCDRALRRRCASSQGISFTAPLSIC
jgi:hypothetical protein